MASLKMSTVRSRDFPAAAGKNSISHPSKLGNVLGLIVHTYLFKNSSFCVNQGPSLVARHIPKYGYEYGLSNRNSE